MDMFFVSDKNLSPKNAAQIGNVKAYTKILPNLSLPQSQMQFMENQDIKNQGVHRRNGHQSTMGNNSKHTIDFRNVDFNSKIPATFNADKIMSPGRDVIKQIEISQERINKQIMMSNSFGRKYSDSQQITKMSFAE